MKNLIALFKGLFTRNATVEPVIVPAAVDQTAEPTVVQVTPDAPVTLVAAKETVAPSTELEKMEVILKALGHFPEAVWADAVALIKKI